MDNCILKIFSNINRTKFKGDDLKYHTVYIIKFESGHYYIGKHSTYNDEDDYFCSGILPNRLKLSGTKYERQILFYSNSAKEAIELETKILSNKKIFGNEFCLNCYPGSPNDATGTITVSKGNKFKMINPKLLEYYLEQGWEQRGIRRIYITNGIENKMILPDEIDEYFENGWILGNSSAKDCIFILKDGKRKFIKREFLDDYVKNGWEYFHNQQDYKVIEKDGKLKKIPKSQLNNYLNDGYELSSTVKNLIYIRKDENFKRVPLEKLQDYLELGWVKGNKTSGQIYICTNESEKRIDINELSFYLELGWKKGRIKKIYLNDGATEKRIFFNNDKLISKLLLEGFKIGRLKRPKKSREYSLDGKWKWVYEN